MSEKQKKQEQIVKDCLLEYLKEAKTNAEEWQDRASYSWDMIHGRIDWSHKSDDQSKVHINRVGRAQEQIKAQLKQGLVNFDKWITVEPEDGFEPSDQELINTENAQRMVLRAIRRTNPKAALSDNIGIALVENVLATKLNPCIERKRIAGKEVKEFYVEHIPLNIRNYYPDAAMSGLYEFYETELDHYKLLALASDKPTPQKPFFLDKVKSLTKTGQTREEKTEEDSDRGNETTVVRAQRRNCHLLHEFWGTVLDENGQIAKWTKADGSELELKDVVIVMADGEQIISEPMPFPAWDGTSNIIAMQVLRSNLNSYGKSILAPGVDMNRAEDELINAGIDAAKKEAYNINTLKVHGLARKEQADGGLKYGDTLLQNNNLAPNEKLVESLSTGRVPQGLLAILDVVRSAGNENMNLNDVALSGNLPSKQVRATELIRADQTIQGLFESFVMDIEDIYIERYAKKVFTLVLQHAKLLSDKDLEYIFYGDANKIEQFKKMTKAELFERYGYSFRFRGKGIRSIAQNARQSQVIVNLFSLMVANPLILDTFERKGIDAAKMLEKVLRGQGIDMEEIIDDSVKEFAIQRQLVREQALAQEEAQTGRQPQERGNVNATNQAAPSGVEPGSGAGSV